MPESPDSVFDRHALPYKLRAACANTPPPACYLCLSALQSEGSVSVRALVPLACQDPPGACQADAHQN